MIFFSVGNPAKDKRTNKAELWAKYKFFKWQNQRAIRSAMQVVFVFKTNFLNS